MHHRKAFLPHGSGFPSARALCRSVCPATSGGAVTARCTRAPGRGAGPEGITPGASALLTAGEEDRLPLALTRKARLGPQGSRCRFSVTLNSHVTLPTNVLPRAV